jgi:hypothetical protein
MSSLYDREPSTRTPFEDLKRPLERAADSPPDNDDIDDGDVSLIVWVQQLIQLIVVLFATVLTPIAARLTELEDDLYSRQRDAANATAPTNVQPVPKATSSGAPQSTSGSKASTKRCDSCHVKGHSSKDCQTADPATMRKRVARNNKIAKENRRIRIQYLPPPIPPTTPYTQAASSSFTPNPMDFGKLSADATEFRRRQAQSARDRRQSRRRPTSTNA